ncbi:hypothetical protein N7520_003148 [Penicillium odoratum]|uniref:uncharacterized protein n=1 Tax=Penicillium odoratum TaxID=1167516 RepID=UPI0025489286|nr:uncharacterized protein N7520_003148 [Penicillium odoratum]KAJ5772619.1 hypothetical protein N7520_003148 [Penicillium odoratum]
MSQQLVTVLATSIAIVDQFQDAISPSTLAQSTQTPTKDAKPLPLLSASSSALKAQVTKLSLLSITTPFTHSAVTKILRDCNDSVLPSLLTAILLVNPAEHTKTFHSETLALVRILFTELATLLKIVKAISEKKDQAKKEDPKSKEEEIVKAEKDAITLATGRVWDACDSVVQVATNGVVGFITRRVEQWRDLVRDAVEELENWDPAEDDDFFDDILGDEKDEEEDAGSKDSDDEENIAAMQEQKKSTLRFLKPIAQVYSAIITYRLKKANDAPLASAGNVARLEKLIVSLQSIPDQVDEVAGALYEEDAPRSVEFLQKIHEFASQAVESVAAPWSDEAEDKFTVWSRTWSKVMEEVSKSIRPDAVAEA